MASSPVWYNIPLKFWKVCVVGDDSPIALIVPEYTLSEVPFSAILNPLAYEISSNPHSR